jgi:hypothetical protein
MNGFRYLGQVRALPGAEKEESRMIHDEIRQSAIGSHSE